MEITKKEFESYELIRQSGKTNMFDVPVVIMLSVGILNREKCLKIMKNYDDLNSKYPELRKEFED